MANLLKIYNASAGSGKTYTLVKEFLNLVLHSESEEKYRRILAMTFTNKAANEMKERILQALIDLSTPIHEKNEKQKSYLQSISSEFELDPDVVEKRAANILSKMLHNYSGLSVMTLDKFTHRIIRTFARDLNLSLDFDVELDLDTLRREVTDMLFDQVGRDKTLTNLMVNYANAQLAEDRSWDFNEQLANFSREIFKENAFRAIEKIQKLDANDFAKIRKDIIEENEKAKNYIMSMAKEALDLIQSKGLTSDDFAGKSKGFTGYLERVAGGKLALPSDTLIKNREEGKWAHTSSSNIGVVESIVDLLEKYFDQLRTVIEEKTGQIELNTEILKNLNNLSLLNHLLKIVNEVKEEENILLISDFYRRIADVIVSEPVPFIYERLGVRYEHFLLDEFQDTSRLQWVNLVPLLENSLSSGNENLIVGDGKQAIYRWRNGEVEQFTKLPEELYNPENVEALNEAQYKFAEEGKRLPLDKNWRSRKAVVEFNNELFDEVRNSLSEDFRYIYDGYAQEAQGADGGYVEVKISKEFEEADQLNYVTDCIRKSVAVGFELKDICVLTRSNKKSSAIAQELNTQGFQVISADSLHLGKDRSVKLVISVFRSMHYASDRNLRKKALEHFAVICQKADPKEVLNQLGDEVDKKPLTQLLSDLGYSLKDSSSFINLYEYAEEVIYGLNLNLQQNPYLQHLLEQIHQFEIQRNASLIDFLDWYDDLGIKSSISFPEGANAVNVMTIHKAKGLEFPVVICPFFDWKMELSDQSGWLEGESSSLPSYYLKMNKKIENGPHDEAYQIEKGKFLLDNMNLMYVAFTRAEEALFISAKDGRGNSPAKEWLIPFFKTRTGTEDGPISWNSGTLDRVGEKKRKGNENLTLRFDKKIMDKPKLSYRQIPSEIVEAVDKKRQFGNNLHLILSKMSKAEDLNQVSDKLYRKGIFNKTEKADLESSISKLFDDPNFSRYFEGESLNEQAIIDTDGSKHIPDKIVRYHDHLLVVDFKTGAESESHHKAQVLKYMHLLKEMGEPNVKGEVYYTESGRAMTV